MTTALNSICILIIYFYSIDINILTTCSNKIRLVRITLSTMEILWAQIIKQCLEQKTSKRLILKQFQTELKRRIKFFMRRQNYHQRFVFNYQFARQSEISQDRIKVTFTSNKWEKWEKKRKEKKNAQQLNSFKCSKIKCSGKREIHFCRSVLQYSLNVDYIRITRRISIF